MNKTKPLASLSLDLDDRWSYLKTHGDTGWETYPSYFDPVIPRVLDFLRERGLLITVFVVGQDAALDKNRDVLSSIAAAGHEIGNHSFYHEPWMHLNSEQEIEAELVLAEEHIERATGRKPIGFRGPGFSLSPTILRVLARRGYLYDASTFPTFLGPMARAYYFMTAKLSPEERQQRKELFGKLKDGLQPIKPYRWKVGEGKMVELPVTTMPVFKLPIHFSYLLYLSTFSSALAMKYFRTAIKLCLMTGTQPSLLLHPPDFLDRNDAPDLSFFPAMRLPSERKLEFISETLHLLTSHFTVLTLQQHALHSGPDLNHFSKCNLLADTFQAQESALQVNKRIHREAVHRVSEGL